MTSRGHNELKPIKQAGYYYAVLTRVINNVPVLVVKYVNIGSGNGLLPDGTKPLPEPMLTYIQYLQHKCAGDTIVYQ